MEILEILILLALTFGGSIVKFLTEKKKMGNDNQPMPDRAEEEESAAQSFREILMKNLETFSSDDGQEDDTFEAEEQDDFLPRAQVVDVQQESFHETDEAPKETPSVFEEGRSAFAQYHVSEDFPKENSDSIEENDISDNNAHISLNEPEELKKAFIYSEILQRKF